MRGAQIQKEGLGGAVGEGGPDRGGVTVKEVGGGVGHGLLVLGGALVGDTTDGLHFDGGHGVARGGDLLIVGVEVGGKLLLVVDAQTLGGQQQHPVSLGGTAGDGILSVRGGDALGNGDILACAGVEPVGVVGQLGVEDADGPRGFGSLVVEVGHDDRGILGGGQGRIAPLQEGSRGAVIEMGDQLLPGADGGEEVLHVGHLKGAGLIQAHVPGVVAVGACLAQPARVITRGEGAGPDARDAIGEARAAAEHGVPRAVAVEVVARKSAAVDVLVVGLGLDEGLDDPRDAGIVVAAVEVHGLDEAMTALEGPGVVPLGLVQTLGSLVLNDHGVHMGGVGVAVAVQLLDEGGGLQVALKGGVAGGGAGGVVGDLLTRDPHHGIAGVAGYHVAGEAQEILQLHAGDRGGMAPQTQGDHEALVVEVLEHPVDLIVKKLGVGLFMLVVQPQRLFAVACLGDEVGLVNGKALLHAVVHDVLELASALASGVVADRGGEVGEALPVGVSQPEEGGAVGVAVVALVLLHRDKAVLGQVGVSRGLGRGDRTRLGKALVVLIGAGDLVAPLTRLGGGEADRPDPSLLPEAGEGDLGAVGVGEDRVDFGLQVGVLVAHLTPQDDLHGRPELGLVVGDEVVVVLGLGVIVQDAVVDLNGQILELNAVQLFQIHSSQIIHAEDPFGEHIAVDLLAGQAQRGGKGVPLSVGHGEGFPAEAHDVTAVHGEQGGVPADGLVVLAVPRGVVQSPLGTGAAEQGTGTDGGLLASRLHGGAQAHRQLQRDAVLLPEGLLDGGEDVHTDGIPGVGEVLHDGTHVGLFKGGGAYSLVPDQEGGEIDGGLGGLLGGYGGDQGQSHRQKHNGREDEGEKAFHGRSPPVL